MNDSINNAGQANTIYNYQNIKIKLLKTNLHIKFNKKCIKNHIIPKYARLKCNDSSEAAKTAIKKAQIIRIKLEIRELYKKKVGLNKFLYKAHLKLLNSVHPAIIDNIIININNRVNDIVNKIYKKQHEKYQNLFKIFNKRDNIECKQEFFPRVQNLTTIEFNNEEINLLEKGLNYNIPMNPINNKTVFDEIINAEAAIKNIKNPTTQIEIRNYVNKKTNKIIKNRDNDNNNNNKINKLKHKHKQESKIINKIKSKIKDNNAIITKSDKGNTIVIVGEEVYDNKIDNFIKKNNIEVLEQDPTIQYSKDVNNAINNCKSLFNDKEKFFLKQTKPKAPKIRGLMKLHKERVPIRPTINHKKAASYKVAKRLCTLLKTHIVLERDKAIHNNTDLVNKIKDIKINAAHKLASLDIVNLYTMVPIHETINIIENNLIKHKKIDKNQINEIINLLNVLLKQNYFRYKDKYFYQKDGLAMGSPISCLLAEIYMNHFENTYVFNKNNAHQNNIIFYTRYVDDILLIYNGTNRQLENLKTFLNKQNKNIQFTLELEKEDSINFLDLNIRKSQDNNLSFKTYRKPTATDATIHINSHHPYAQKMAAYNSFVYRLLTIPMNKIDFDEEVNTIKHIAVKNGYHSSIIDKLISRHRKKIANKNNLIDKNNEAQNKEIKYTSATFGNYLPNILFHAFKKQGVTISFSTDNKIERILHPKDNNTEIIAKKAGIYKMICDCGSIYIGQTARDFFTRYTEHLPLITIKKNTVIKSNFAKHLITNNHEYKNKNFEDFLTPMHIYDKKGNYMNALEEYEIYKAFKNNDTPLLNDKLQFKSNSLYDTIINKL